MKRLLIFILLCTLVVGCYDLKASAEYYPSPQVTEHDIRVWYFPDIATNLYRVCDNNGKLIRFIDFQDVAIELMDDLTDAHSGDKFVFKITLKSPLVKDEYMELIILDENEITVYNNDIKVPVDKIGEYNIIHIIDSGIIRIC